MGLRILSPAAVAAVAAASLAAGCANSAPASGYSALEHGDGGSSGSGSTSSGATATGTSSGTSGGGQTSSSGSSSSGSTSSGATPPEPGVMYPFPQNRHYANCTYPKYSNTIVQSAYTKWKNTLVTSNGAGGYQRVQRPEDGSDTVSEGIGYGMLLAVYMNDQTLFDNLWQYEQHHLDNSGLMTWHFDQTGNAAGSGAATDADEDMAWALLMADKQWSTSPTLGAYLPLAKAQIAAIWTHEINSGSSGSLSGPLPALGDSWGGWPSSAINGTPGINISYFAPAYYRVFSAVDTAHDWRGAVDTVYGVISANLNAGQGNQSNGLVPGFSMPDGSQMNGQGSNYSYQYDACRTPFRIGIDWCFNGEPRAEQYLGKIVTFFSGIGADNVRDGYSLSGTPTGTAVASPFLGPAAVGAMSSSSFGAFLQAAYGVVTAFPMQGGEYYAESWTAISLVMLSGNFLDFTHLP